MEKETPCEILEERGEEAARLSGVYGDAAVQNKAPSQTEVHVREEPETRIRDTELCQQRGLKTWAQEDIYFERTRVGSNTFVA
jgi:hypothetical protein